MLSRTGGGEAEAKQIQRLMNVKGQAPLREAQYVRIQGMLGHGKRRSETLLGKSGVCVSVSMCVTRP